MPIITTTTAGYSVKEIQYGGGKNIMAPEIVDFISPHQPAVRL